MSRETRENESGRNEREEKRSKNTHRGRASSILRSADVALYSVNPPLRPIKSARIAKKSYKDGDKKRRGNRKRWKSRSCPLHADVFVSRSLPGSPSRNSRIRKK